MVFAQLVQRALALCTCREECNKYDVTGARVYNWPIIIIGPCGLLLVVLHLFAVPSFNLIGGVAK
jgi:hypothetical protein